MKLKSIVPLLIAILALLLASCGDNEPEQKHLDYENAVSTFVGAFNKEDESTLLSCFTPAVRDEFSLTEQSAVSLLDENIRKSCGEYTALSYKVTDKTELSDEEIDELRTNYNSQYGKRLSIKKAYSLNVTFYITSTGVGAEKKSTVDKTLVTIKTDDGWCIVGDVITEIY